MKGIVVDAKNPSQAYLEGYPNSNCEQYQEMLDQVPANKRKAFVEKIQTHYQKLLTQRKLEFKDSVKVLSDEIEKFLASGGTISMGKNGTYLFNGFLTLRAEPFFYDRTMYETQLKNLKERKQKYVDELSDLNEKANKHLFKSAYKKEEREQLKKMILYLL